MSAQFHGVTSLLIGLPIVWEATARFRFLGPGTAAVVLAILSTLAFVVSRRGHLHAVTGVAGFGTLAAALATAWSTNHHASFSLLLIALGTATYWLAEAPARGWLRWPTAIAAGLSVMAVTARAMAMPALEATWLTLLTQAVLVATMQGSLAVRVLMFDRNVRVFDMLQAASGMAIGIWGAALIARGSPAGLGLIGAMTAILASGAYLAAFSRLADRPRMAASYHTFTTFGLAAVVTALVLMFNGAVLAMAALVLSALTIVFGRKPLGGYASLHGAAYVTTALAASGVLSLAVVAWTQNPAPWPSVSWLAWLTLAATAACVRLRPAATGEPGEILTRSGRLVMAFAFVFGVGGALVIFVAPVFVWLSGSVGGSIDSGVLASLRTGLLSLLVVGLGLSARWPKMAVFSRLVYPVLILGGMRLLIDDFRHSQAATLFIALALYGVALALGPRLAQRK